MKQLTKWKVDSHHSEIAFMVRHLMITNVKGVFKTFQSSICTRGKDFTTAEIDFWIDVSSISTDDEIRDKHLKGPDFLDVKNYRQITFTSLSIGKADADGNHELWGKLTIKGITKRIPLNVKFLGVLDDAFANEKAGFIISGVIKRSDWGLNWNKFAETGGLILSKEVVISCKVELRNTHHQDLIMELRK